MIVGNCDTLLLIVERKNKQKTKKKIGGVSNTIDNLYLTDIYGTFSPQTAQ